MDAAGGEILYIEVSAIKGKGGLTLTGPAWGRNEGKRASRIDLCPRQGRRARHWPPDFAEHTDIHIHVPAGATPKDGPSAGVTLVTRSSPR